MTTRAAWAGIVYFGIVFGAGFVLGTLRVLVLAPKLGEGAAVLLELPIILAVSWVACRRLIAHFRVPNMLADRLVMGGLAFGVLLGAEICVSVIGFQRTLLAHLEQYLKLPAFIGLVGQIVFAMFPVFQRTSEVG